MSQQKNEYFAIPIASLKDCFRETPCDIYIEISQGYYVKTFDKRTGIDFQRLANYESKEVDTLFVKKTDLQDFEEFLARSPMVVLTNDGFPIEEKKSAFISALEQSFCEVFEKVNIPPEISNKVIDTINSAIESELNFTQLFLKLVELSGNRDVFYRHSIHTCVYSFLLMNTLEMSSERSLKIILFSSLFHDIGKITFPKNKRSEGSFESLDDLKKFQKHPLLSADMVAASLQYSPEEIKRCIQQHRERFDGNGYPMQIKNIHIFELSKVLAVAEYFSEMTLGMVDGKKYTTMQALSVMKSDPGHFDSKIFNPFFELLTRSYLRKRNAA